MKLIRYETNGVISYGDLVGDQIHPLEGALPDFRRSGAAPIPVSSVKLKAPLEPSKLICIGPGSKTIIGSLPIPPRPILWVKPATAVCASGDTIQLPLDLGMPVNHESELAIVIGRKASKVAPEEAMSHVFGYTCVNDLTVGDMVNRAAWRTSEWFIDGKIFDTFCPLGPHVDTDIDPDDLRIRCWVNGVLKQDGRSSERIWRFDSLIAHISNVMTLLPGDVICTGAVPQPGALNPGDEVIVEVEGIGRLVNPVAAGKSWSNPVVN